MDDNFQVPVVVPAAGIGKRMASDIPKQYLSLAGKTILEHTVERLLSHPNISCVIIALNPQDTYFNTLPLANHKNVITVVGGDERCDSVLSGLHAVKNTVNSPYVLVHDAARPCITHHDISQLIGHCIDTNRGGILASRVRDTMKRSSADNQITHSEPRENLWHALTPQLFKTDELTAALIKALAEHQRITDEASAMEYCHYPADVIPGRADNIKVTQPEDLHLAEFILQQQHKQQEGSPCA
ncbi:2-C-methyl-D-erythritol 4-phosphate cytidylyltransferase [Thalassotalea litorea]|uniref:2-C-methyl-D-erythritol 4-phosphate cytidylyltransferase n=1 Tax=Thalassotalea litorea TaxID=2020715 RepID=UPI001BB0F85B